MNSPRDAAAKRSYNKSGVFRGRTASKTERKHKLREVASSASSKAQLVSAAIGVLHRLEKPSLCRTEKEKKLRAVMDALESEDGSCDDDKV